MSPKKKGRGQPTKYRPEYCERLVEHMTKGLSFESFAAQVDVSRDTLYEWAHKHPDFSDAKGRGDSKARLFWEEMGVEGVFLSPFNQAVWSLHMKNRFGWRDKQEIEQRTETTVKVEGVLNLDQWIAHCAKLDGVDE